MYIEISKLKCLYEEPYKYFLMGFLLAPFFILGCVFSESYQSRGITFGAEAKPAYTGYANVILASLTLREGDKANGLQGQEAWSSVKEKVLPKLKKMNFMEMPTEHRSVTFSPKSEFKVSYIPSKSTDRIYNRSLTTDFQEKKLLDRLLPDYSAPQIVKKRTTDLVDVPMPVRKQEFLGRSKHYYGWRMDEKQRDKEMLCLATGIYFEARGESRTGQIAVAQVIINRVKLRYYPGTICKVVYQGSHRKTGCQFSFTCDGISDRPRNRRLWRRTVRLAKQVMDGKHYLKEIGNASHYHATYVKPIWIKFMYKRKKIGLHIFYRGKFLKRRRYASRKRYTKYRGKRS